MARDTSPLTTGFAKLGFTLGALPRLRQQIQDDRAGDQADLASKLALADSRAADAEFTQRKLDRALQIVSNLERSEFQAPPGFKETANPYADSQAEAATAFGKFGDAETQRRLIEGDTEGMDVGRAMALLNASGMFSESGGRVLDRYEGTLDESGQQAQANVGATRALKGARERTNTPKGGKPRTLSGPQLKFFEVKVGEDRFTKRPIYAVDTDRLSRFRRWMADQELTDEPSALNQWLLESEPDAGDLSNALGDVAGDPGAVDELAADVETGEDLGLDAGAEPTLVPDAARVLDAIARARAAGRDDLADRIEAEARAEGVIK